MHQGSFQNASRRIGENIRKKGKRTCFPFLSRCLITINKKRREYQMGFESIGEMSNNPHKIEAYYIPVDLSGISKEADKTINRKNKAMMVNCRACGRSFETTFSVDDFERLSSDQSEAGTLHICPHCGDLGLYKMKDYFEMPED